MKRIWRAFIHSCAGLKAAFADEASFRQDVALVAVLVPLAFWLAPDRLSLALMLGTAILLLIVELLNTGIEAVVDRIGEDFHLQSKKAKDCGSAAVLFSLLLLAVTWAAILL